eukprot:6316211-Amphidinium_carterae.1
MSCQLVSASLAKLSFARYSERPVRVPLTCQMNGREGSEPSSSAALQLKVGSVLLAEAAGSFLPH